jgi:hypothetical protein
MPPLPDPVRRALRSLTPGRNPLARRSDRLEALSWVAAAFALVLVLPIALAVGTVVGAGLSARAHEQAVTRHEESAVLLADPLPAEDRFPAVRSLRFPAVWSGPDGAVHGEVLAPVDARAGGTVTIWVDEAGRQVPRPIDRTVVASNALVAGILSFLLLTTAVVTGQCLLGALLGWHRARQWAADWAVVEPRWAGRADH